MKFFAYGLFLLSAALLSESMTIRLYDVKDDLKKDIDQLKEEAKKEIDKLKAEGKIVLAVGLETIEKKLEDLESQVEKLDPETDAGKLLLTTLEGLVKKAEDDLKAEIKKLEGGSPVVFDIKDDLKAIIDKLKEEANKEIDKLKAEGKTVLAEGLEAIEKRVLDIESQLEKLDLDSVLGKAALTVIEGLLKTVEEDLEAEVKKLEGGSPVVFDIKDDLKTIIDKLKEEANKEIDKLKAEGKAVLAEGLEAIEKRVLDIESQIEKLNPESDLDKVALAALEVLLKKAEEELEAEVKKLEGGSPVVFDVKDDLKKTIDELKDEAKKEIEKLEAEGKVALAVGLQTIEKKLEDLESQVEKLDPETDAGKLLLAALEGLVKKAEDDLKAEIKKISGGFYDATDDLNKLLIEGEKIKKEVQDEIEKLKKEGKTLEAEGLEAIEKRVLDIESQLEKLNPDSELGKAALTVIEGLLKKVEEDLEAEVKKLEGGSV